MNNLKILNINASRINKRERILNLLYKINSLGPNIVCIQEINIRAAYNIFKDCYECIINEDIHIGEGIGIMTLVKKDIIIREKIIGEMGE